MTSAHRRASWQSHLGLGAWLRGWFAPLCRAKGTLQTVAFEQHRLRFEPLEARQLLSATLTSLASFSMPNGADPWGSLVEDSGGNVFGTTTDGGPGDYGTVFEIKAGSNAVTTLVSFNGVNGSDPVASPIEDSSGNLFGTTGFGGAYGDGTVFEIKAGSNVVTTLVSFNFDVPNAEGPDAGLVEDSSGNLFGTTANGGSSGNGTVFEVKAGSNTVTTLASFNGGANGATPVGGVIEDGSGNLFGTSGGGLNYGTVFEVKAGSNAVTTLVYFNQTDGAYPGGGLIEDSSGNLFGTTENGGSNSVGTAFEIKAGSNAVTTLVSFNGVNGGRPGEGLVEDSGGNLYGTTMAGGSSNYGTVFEVQAGSDAVTTLASFNGTNGESPAAGLVEDSNGNLYSTTEGGGPGGYGTVFEIKAGSGAVTTLAAFGNTEGVGPHGALIEDSSGNLFGTTEYGDPYDDGTVFEVKAGSDAVITLASFNGANGQYPYGGLIEDSSGNLFGTTTYGGSYDDGTVFEVPAGSNAVTTLVSFNGTNGEWPCAGLVEDGSGNLFGTTYAGGSNGEGTVFEFKAGSDAVTTLVSFNGTNGAYPYAGLIEDSSGNFFGTTAAGGSNNDGTVFEVKAGSNVVTTLVSFNGTNGAECNAGLVEDSSGDLFGTTYGGGGDGTVFEIEASSNTVTTLVSCSFANGSAPYAALIEDSSGNLFGTTCYGGPGGYGTVFEISTLPATTTTVGTSQTPVVYGTPVTFTATVTAQSGSAAPTAGSVDFFDTTTSTDLGLGTLVSSTSTTSTWTLTTGVKTFNVTAGDTITANYTGGINFIRSSGNTSEAVAARALTVAALSNTKVYDGTTLSTTLPAITSGSLVSGDTAAFSETYSTKNVGTGKTLTAAGSVNDGNGGNNYTVTRVNNTTGQITPLAITVIAAASTKGYDGTAATPTIPSGAVVTTLAGSAGQQGSSNGTGSTAMFYAPQGVAVDSAGNIYVADYYNDEIRKITPSGVVSTLAGSPGQTGSSDGTGSAARFYHPSAVAVDNASNVYVADFYNDEIRKITPSGVVTTLAGLPGRTGSSDGTGSAARFDNPSGVTVDSVGNVYVADSGNDAIRLVNGGDEIVGLVSGDTAAFTQSFDNKNVGTGKRLTLAGSVNDGNHGGNYAVTFITNTTGQITPQAITITAATATKTYDGTTSSPATPAITGGSLASGDTAAFIETFDTRNVGTTKTLTAAGSVNDCDGGADYTVTLVANTTGVITAREITVSATASTKTYDGTTSAAATPTVSGLQGGDSVTGVVEAYADANAGTEKTLSVTGYTVNDGNSGGNYTISLVNVAAGAINKANAAVLVTPYNVTYDGASQTATGTATGVGSASLSGLDLSGTTHTNAGTYSDGWTFTDVTGNYNNASGSVNDSVGQAPLTVTATGVSKIYDGTTTARVVLSDNRVAGDNLTDSYTQASFSNAGPGQSMPVSVNGIAISGPDAGNYALQNTTASTTTNIYQSVALIDDGDPAWTTTGMWTNFAGQGYAGDVDQATPVTSTNTLATSTWTFNDLDPNQQYLVETTWSRNSNRATNAPYTISGGPSTVTLPVTVNQQQATVGANANNGAWQELGLYEPTTGTIVVTLSNSGANGNVIADAVRLEPVPASGPAIMVQAGTTNGGATATDPIVLPMLSGSVQTTVSFGTTPAGSVAQKIFTVFNGGGGALSLSNLSVPAGYTLVAGFGTTGTTTVQPGDSTTFVVGQNSSTAGTFGGTASFTTNDSPENPFSFLVTGTVGNVPPTATMPSVSPVAVGTPVTIRLINPSDPSSADAKAGFHYSFAFSEAALSKSYGASGAVASATYTLTTAGTFTAWGRIIDVNGLYTDYSTQVTVTSTSLVIDDSNNSNDAPGAWAAAMGTWTNWTGQGYDGNVHQATPVTSTNPVATATWTFTGLSPSQYYKVETTWTQSANRATNAPYTISGGTVTLPVVLNQQQPPVGVSTNNGTWQELGVYEATTGTLVVTLSNSGANGNVIADAVRLEPVPVSGPAIMVQAGTGSPTDPVLIPGQTVVSFGTTPAGSVAQKTFTVFNGGGGALSLSNLTVPAGYTVVSGGFGATPLTVPSGGSAQFVLQETTSAPGTFSGTVSFTTNDSAGNNFFRFPITGTVMVVAPAATIANTGPVTAGNPVTVSLSNPKGSAAPYHYSFGFTEAALSKSYGTSSPIASATYTFTTTSTYLVWGRILDKNGLYTDYSTQVVVNALPMVIMKAGTANFQPTGTWTNWGTASAYLQGYAADDQEAAADSSSTATATATWTFNGLTVGAVYQVYVTWPASRNRASNVPCTVTVGGSVMASVSVNQQISPPTSLGGSEPSGGAYNWYQLGAAAGYTIGVSGTVVVKISNAGANGYVEADAVMLVQTQPELAADGPGHNPHAAPLTVSEAMPLVHEAELCWAAAGANISSLGNIQVSVTNLPGLELGESSSLVDTIYLDTTAQGYGWFIDPTPGQDNEFPVQAAKSEDLATRGPAANEMDLLTVIMHEMGHFLGHDDLNPQASPYDLMSADLAAGVRRLPDSAVLAAVTQGRSTSDRTSGQGSAAAGQVQAKDTVFAALSQSQGGTTQDKAAGHPSGAWWLLYGQQ